MSASPCEGLTLEHIARRALKGRQDIASRDASALREIAEMTAISDSGVLQRPGASFITESHFVGGCRRERNLH